MNNSIDDRLVDETLDAYIEWRKERARVRNAYRLWSTASPGHAADAFDEYLTALNYEEQAANDYARLIRCVAQHVSARRQHVSARRQKRRSDYRWRAPRSWWRRRSRVTHTIQHEGETHGIPR